MKKYKFKLDALLKLRTLKEDQCKMQIGQLRVEITRLQSLIDDHHKGIELAYDSQEGALGSGLIGQELRFHPYFVEGKRAHIGKIQKQIKILEEQAQEKYLELNQLRGDVKVIAEMKEKDQVKFKKEVQKKQFEEIEEQNQNWREALK